MARVFKNKPPATMGRTQIPIDWNEVDKMLEVGSPGTEIANIIGCSADTLYQRCWQEYGVTFTSYAAKRRSKGLEALRAKQHEVAMKGDRTLLVWLGKNYLDQKDTMQEAAQTTINLTIKEASE